MFQKTLSPVVYVCLALLILTAMPAQAVSTTVVISQVYGGGGNSTAQYTNDFIELHNVSSSPVSVTGWSVQYTSAAGTSWSTTALSGTIAPGGYYLVQEAAGANTTLPALPTPDATGTLTLSATAGKVALVNSTTALSVGCPTAGVIDFVGFGTAANCFEGTGPTPAPANNKAVIRAGGGCTDTDVNSADFTATAPAPRNSASAALTCDVAARTDPSGSGTATSTVPNGYTVLTVTVMPGGNPTSTNIQVVGNLTSIGGSSAQTFAISGGLVYTYSALVPDTVVVGTKSVPVTITDDEGRTATTNISVSVVAPAPAYAIHAVQGNGNASPLAGQRVMVSGIVTQLTTSGFYLEAPESAWDTDDTTSEGVYIYTGAAPTVTVGDAVDVHGTVQEYNGTTEISGSPVVVVSTHANTLPAVIDIAPDPAGSIDQLERYEGMLVRLASPKVVGPTGISGTKSNGIFYVTGDVPRPFREPGIQTGIALPSGMPANYPKYDGNPERVKVDSSACTTPANVGVGDPVPAITGALGYNADFTIYACPVATSQIRAVPLADRAVNEFTVASFNMLSFTNNAARITKASKAIREIMRSPDVIGVEEMNNITTLQALADAINSDSPADSNPRYAASLLATSGSQNVGFLYRQDRLSNVNVQQVGAELLMPDGTNKLNDRPPLVMTAQIMPPTGAGFPVTIIVNHLRSLIDVDTVGSTGDFARTKRKLGAEYLASLIAQHQSAGESVISVGDYNAYEFNDGYVDVLGTVTGNPAPADQVLLPGSDLLDPNAVDLAMTLPAERRYSYVENGNAQTLDHIVVTSNLLRFPFHLEVAHNNAEFPELLSTDSSRSERVSDHDMPVAYFRLPPSADSVTPTGGTGDTTFTFKYSDPSGYDALTYVQGIIGNIANYNGTCAFYFVRDSRRIYLHSDGDTWLPAGIIGQTGTASNNQCTLDAGASSASGSDGTLTLNVALQFKPAFIGQRTIFAFAGDQTANSGWKALASWTPSVTVVQQVAPSVDNVTPNPATGPTQQFDFQFSSVNGGAYIAWAQGIANINVGYSGGCAFHYSATSRNLYLQNDAGTAWASGKPLGTTGIIENSQCTIDVGASSATVSGNSLTLHLAITAKAGVLGQRTIWGYAADNGGRTSGWTKVGTWTAFVPVATPPVVVSAATAPGTTTFRFSSANGGTYFNWVQAMIANSFGYPNACAILYSRPSNKIYLQNDAGSAWVGGFAPGQVGTITNSQCTINTQTSTVVVSGNDLTLNLATTYAAGFTGTHNAWGYALDIANAKSNWVSLGSFNVQ